MGTTRIPIGWPAGWADGPGRHTVVAMTQPATPNHLGTTLRQTVRDTGYVLLGFPSALVAFVVVFTLCAVGVALSVTIVGLPVLVTALYAARGFADFERLQLPQVLRRPAFRPRYRRSGPDAGPVRRALTPLRDGQSWLDLLHAVTHWILMTVSFCVIVVWWAVTLGGLTSFAWYRYIPRGPDSRDLYDLLGQPGIPGGREGLMTGIGLVFLLLLPLVVRMFALVPAQFGRVLLTGIAEVRNQITGLREQRDSAVSAEATALRKLERDIHDGPQQRLVRLAMDLSRAKAQLATDPSAASATLDEALGQTRETLDELRALSRGIAPPVLADRGLPSALAALASRGTIPVALDIDPELGRLPAVVENTAYFLVAESLTNVAKHSGATTCGVEVARLADRRPRRADRAGGAATRPGTSAGAVGNATGITSSAPSSARPRLATAVPSTRPLRVVIRDDGRGGAHLSKGHGLAGLADRVRAAGGTLAVTSPAGGPTEITAELPCG